MNRRIAEWAAGVSYNSLERNKFQRELLRGSQAVRTRQSKSSLGLVVFVGLAYLWFLWETTQPVALTIWVAAALASSSIRARLCTWVQQTLDDADANELLRNEVLLIASGLVSPAIIGASFWFVAWPGTERTLFAITVMSCMYATGSTINTSTHGHTFAFILFANIGQAILFFAGFGNRPDYALAVLLIAFSVLLMRFGKLNSAFFAESVRMRLENQGQNARLRESQRIVENSLEVALDASRSKSRFLAAASHDLRQPLHAMMLFIGALKAADKESAREDIVNKIEETAEKLRTQFEGLLDLSRFDADGVTLRYVEFRLDDMLASIVDDHMPIADEKQLDLVLRHSSTSVPLCSGEALASDVASGSESRPSSPGAVRLISDPLLLERLLGNLIGNAIKYTRQGTVTVDYGERGTMVFISVSDTGVGIEASDKERIFEDFAQLDNPSRRATQGTGLGLAIVRRIASLLHVEISVDSEVGVGSTFELCMPRVAYEAGEKFQRLEESREEVAETSAATAGRSPRYTTLAGEVVMVIDDDPLIRDALKEHLHQRAARVLLGECMLSAEQLMSTHQVSFALIDDMLNANQTGLEVAEMVAGSIGRDKVLLITGSENSERFREIEERGFTVVRKPLGAAELDGLMGVHVQPE